MTVLFAEAGADALSAQVDLASSAVNESLVQVRRRVACEILQEDFQKASFANVEVALGGPDHAHRPRLFVISIGIRDEADLTLGRRSRGGQIFFPHHGLIRAAWLKAIESPIKRGEDR